MHTLPNAFIFYPHNMDEPHDNGIEQLLFRVPAKQMLFILAGDAEIVVGSAGIGDFATYRKRLKANLEFQKIGDGYVQFFDFEQMKKLAVQRFHGDGTVVSSQWNEKSLVKFLLMHFKRSSNIP